MIQDRFSDVEFSYYSHEYHSIYGFCEVGLKKTVSSHCMASILIYCIFSAIKFTSMKLQQKNIFAVFGDKIVSVIFFDKDKSTAIPKVCILCHLKLLALIW